MKVMFKSATESFAEAHSIERFIYLNGPERGSEVVPDSATLTPDQIIARQELGSKLDAAIVSLRVADEGGEVVLHAQRNGVLVEKAIYTNLSFEDLGFQPGDIESIRLWLQEKLAEQQKTRVALGGIDRPIVVTAPDSDAPIMDSTRRNPDVPIGFENRAEPVETTETVEALNSTAELVTAFKTANGLTGTVDNSRTSGSGVRSVSLGDRQAFVVSLPADVQAQIAPDGRFSGSGEENNNLAGFLNGTLAVSAAAPNGAPVVAPAKTTEVVTETPLATLDLDAMDDSDILDLVDSLDGLTGRALQTRINELADQLGLTFSEGGYVENGRLVVDGSVGRTTREAQQQVVEMLQSHIPEEADHYISVLNDLENATSVDEIMNAVSGNQVQARMLQRDLKLLGFYNGGIDGVLGRGSRGALTAALADERFDNVYQIEAAAREAEVVAEGERHGRRNPSVDALMTKIREQGAASITAADVAFTGRENGGSADRTREVMDFIEQAVAAGDIEQTDASGILEMMMAEDSYPDDMALQDRIAATLHDSSSRFIVGLSSINPETRIREVSVALRNRIRGRESRAELAADMMANNGVPAQSFGAVDYHAEGVDPIVQIDGQEFDMRTLTKMYIITGGGQTAQGTGAVEVPIGPMSSRLNVHNLVYRDGALVGTMENGCRGNLVVIPVNRQYVRYVPPAPRREPAPRTPGTPETPVEGGPRCVEERGHCFSGRRAIYRVCYAPDGTRLSRDRIRYEADSTCEIDHCCFPAGTKVSMADGSKQNIEDVLVGAMVVAYDEASAENKVATVKELETPVREGVYHLNENLLRVTDEHPIYVTKASGEKGWASLNPAKALEHHKFESMLLEIGDSIQMEDGSLVKLETADFVEGEIQTYNLSSVDQYNTFYADGVLVHNKNDGCGCGDNSTGGSDGAGNGNSGGL